MADLEAPYLSFVILTGPFPSIADMVDALRASHRSKPGSPERREPGTHLQPGNGMPM